MNKKRMLIKAMAGTALCPLTTSRAAETAAARPHTHYFPNSLVTTHENKQMRFYDELIKGKIVVINMMYAVCTGKCPINTASLIKLQDALGERLGRDIFMYSLTLLPDQDTSQVLNDYVAKYGIRPGWRFLTGKPDDIDIIRRKLGFYSRRPEEDADLAQHTGMVRIGNEAIDRWCMAPAQSSTRQILSTIAAL
jgi:protein SCO1/2